MSFRSLENYKKQQKKIAEGKGVGKELANAKTLTEARKIVYGSKQKVISGWKGHSDWVTTSKGVDAFAKRPK